MDTISQKLSAFGLMSELHRRVRVKRKSTSLNTVHLAFKDPTTPLRKMIVEMGEQLLAEHEAQAAESTNVEEIA